MPFLDNLRQLRLTQFFSQAELARRTGLHMLTISRLEAGRAKPSTRTVRVLADALGVAPGKLANARGSRRSRPGSLARSPPPATERRALKQACRNLPTGGWISVCPLRLGPVGARSCIAAPLALTGTEGGPV
jgi:transcriptional regulator with XRE-family HTH domain